MKSQPPLPVPKFQNGICMLRFPIEKKQVSSIDSTVRTVTWDVPPSDRDACKIAEIIAAHPEIELSPFRQGVPKREHLRLWNGVRRMSIDCYTIRTFDDLAELGPNVQKLSLGATKRLQSLKVLECFDGLRCLSIEGHSKHIESVWTRLQLRRLRLRSITLPDLSGCASLRKLWWLWIGLGGTRNLQGIERLDSLRYFEIFRVRGLASLDSIAQCRALEEFHVEALPQVKCLPNLRAMLRLRKLTIETMKGISDLSPITHSRSIQSVTVWSANHMQPQDFQCLRGHPTLQHLAVLLGSAKKDNVVRSMFGPSFGFDLRHSELWRPVGLD